MAATPSASPRWTRKPEVAWVDSEDRVALLDLDHLDSPAVILEGSSAVIWRLIDGVEETALVERVAEHYGVSASEVAGALATFIAELRDRGLVVTAGDS